MALPLLSAKHGRFGGFHAGWVFLWLRLENPLRGVGGWQHLSPGTAMANINIDIDLPEGVEITGYERCGDGHGFEVTWPWPERCRCQRCGHEDQARLEQSGKQRVVRHLDVWNQPSFWIYEGVFHRCGHCHHRQDLIPPFKGKETSYTYGFEEHVVRLLIGSTEQDVARRLGISAETVGRIVKNQLQDAKTIDPCGDCRCRHGRDQPEEAAQAVRDAADGPDRSGPPAAVGGKARSGRSGGAGLPGVPSAAQREQVRSYRVDMGARCTTRRARAIAQSAWRDGPISRGQAVE